MSVYDENNQPANPEALVDRLVDGELGEADRRELLLQLEHEPDGWRRCALAFLEAQCWKAELGQMVPPPAPQAALAAPVSRAEPAGRWQSWRQYVATTLTMAASFLIALVLGMGLRGTWPGITLHSPGSSQVQSTIDKIPLPEAQPRLARTLWHMPCRHLGRQTVGRWSRWTRASCGTVRRRLSACRPATARSSIRTF